jgi:hypothetical protein
MAFFFDRNYSKVPAAATGAHVREPEKKEEKKRIQ